MLPLTAAVARPVHVAPLTAATPPRAIAAAPSVYANDAAAGTAELGGYYGPADGKKGADLLRSLHLIIRTGHIDRGYAQARDEMFSTVDDIDGDDRVEDLFTGELRGPINNRKNAFDKGFNTEHTWPQSKGATGIAQSDLHHLRSSDIVTNERRGSHPYGDVQTVEWSTGSGANEARLGVDAMGATVFEPRESIKGDVARGLLYFYTRYSQSRPGRFTLENFKHELPTLIRWHQADPVTDAERKRNDAVQAVQGNRNPYVDRPEFVDQVDFAHLDLGRG